MLHDKDMSDEKVERPSMMEEGNYDNVGLSHLERKVLFKMDVRILPILALLFLCSFIDRTNVGNAKILGLQKDIGITDHQYAIGLCVFYATYIARSVDLTTFSLVMCTDSLVVSYLATSSLRRCHRRSGCPYSPPCGAF